MVNRLEAMEMFLWRRIMKIPWTIKRSNIDILEMVVNEGGEEEEQLKFLKHVMRKESLENLIMTEWCKVAREG